MSTGAPSNFEMTLVELESHSLHSSTTDVIVFEMGKKTIRIKHHDLAIAAAVAGGLIVVPILGPAALALVGFGPSGPVAGTIAAGIQSSIGSVAAGSAFAGAQAAAMGAGVPLIGLVIGGALIGAATIAGIKIYELVNSEYGMKAVEAIQANIEKLYHAALQALLDVQAAAERAGLPELGKEVGDKLAQGAEEVHRFIVQEALPFAEAAAAHVGNAIAGAGAAALRDFVQHFDPERRL